MIPQEMLACGLPVVELAGVSGEGVFGSDAGVTFAPFDPVTIADSIEDLLSDNHLCRDAGARGIRWARPRTWDRGADAIECGALASVCTIDEQHSKHGRLVRLVRRES